MHRVVVLLALAALTSAQITCTNIDTNKATGVCGGTTYDLSQMTTATGSQYVTVLWRKVKKKEKMKKSTRKLG